jgi:hypothetical protein
MSKPDLANLDACIEDARLAALDTDPGPSNPTEFNNLRGRLVTAREHLPPLYRQAVADPFIAVLNQLGRDGFTDLLINRPDLADILIDIAHTILQNGEGFEPRATDAFQEVISDLYDGFLSAEDRVGVQPPDNAVIAPLVKWGNPDFGPYTFPLEATSIFGSEAALVSLPPSNARRGIMAWAALGHEAAGHDILRADNGLQQQLATAVFNGVNAANLGGHLARYWRDRIDETASDVMGILNMGPAAGIGLIAFFRGLNAAFTGEAKLRSSGPEGDVHPADILRGYLAAETVRLLEFSDAAAWADAIEEETDKDVAMIRLAGQVITKENAKKSAQAVAVAVVNTPLPSLENQFLGNIQNWRDRDENIVAELVALIGTPSVVTDNLERGFFAAHAVAAGVTATLAPNANIGMIFNRMLDILKRMHDRSPSWGPLFVMHPGDLARHRAYMSQAADIHFTAEEAPARPARRRR